MKKNVLQLIMVLVFGLVLNAGLMAQNVAINNDGSDPHASAMLDIQAENMGLLIPRITEANLPADPATGLLIYQTDGDAGFYYYDGAEWKRISNNSQLGTMASQDADNVTITGGSIDGVAIGAIEPSTGKFTTLNATATTTLEGDLIVQADTDMGYNFMVDAATGEVTAYGNIQGKELQTLSGNMRIAEDGDNLPWINVLKNGNKVFEMGLGTNAVGEDAGYGLNINNDEGQTVAGMGFSHGEWVNGVVDPSTLTIAGAATDGAGNTMIQIKSMEVKEDLFKADNLGNVMMSNDLTVGNDGMVYGNFTIGEGFNKAPASYLTVNGILQIPLGAADGYYLKSNAQGEASWGQITNTDISGLGTMATQDADNVNITGGTIDGTPIGTGSKGAAAGAFTTLYAGSNAIVEGDLFVGSMSKAGGNVTLNQKLTAQDAEIYGTVTSTTLDVSSNAIVGGDLQVGDEVKGGNINLTGSLEVSTDATVYGNLTIGYDYSFDGPPASTTKILGQLQIPNGASDGYVLTSDANGNASWEAASSGGGSSGLSSFGYVYQLATLADATVVGGADVPFSNNGPLQSVTHSAGTITVTVSETGTYKVDYNVTITAGVGSAIAVAVNGTVDASTVKSCLVATGEVSGTAIMTLAAGDVLTLRNNSAIAMTLGLAPAVGAQFTVTKMD